MTSPYTGVRISAPASGQRQTAARLLIAPFLLGAALALANSPPQPQSSMHVADDAHQLSPAAIETIESRFRDYEARHAVQLVLFTTNDASEQGRVLEKLAEAKRDALKQSRGEAERLVFAANFNLRFESRNTSVGMAATRALGKRFDDAGNAMFQADNGWLKARLYSRSVSNAELILGTADALMQVLDGKPIPVSPEIRAREADEARTDPIAKFLFDHGIVFPVLMFTGFACAWLGAGIAQPEWRWSYGLFAFGLAMFIALPIGLVAGLSLQALGGIFITGYLWLFLLLTLSVWWTIRPQDLPPIRGLRRYPRRPPNADQPRGTG